MARALVAGLLGPRQWLTRAQKTPTSLTPTMEASLEPPESVPEDGDPKMAEVGSPSSATENQPPLISSTQGKEQTGRSD